MEKHENNLKHFESGIRVVFACRNGLKTVILKLRMAVGARIRNRSDEMGKVYVHCNFTDNFLNLQIVKRGKAYFTFCIFDNPY